MAKGGKRPGAGRPKGAQTKRTRAIAERATAEGKTPLEVMLEIMADALAKGDQKTALEAAKDAAPYVHPRLANVQHEGKDGGPIKIEVVTGIDRSAG